MPLGDENDNAPFHFSSETGIERMTDLPLTTSRNQSVPLPNGLSGAEMPHAHGNTHPGARTPLYVPIAARPPSNKIRADPLNTPVRALKLNEYPAVLSSESVLAPTRTVNPPVTATSPYLSLAATFNTSNSSVNGAPGS